MKINICIIILVLLFSLSGKLYAQPKNNLSGIWIAKSGTSDNPGELYFSFIHANDSLKTIVSLPMYGNKFLNMPLPTVALKGDSIRFPTFDGKYLAEKDQITANINFLYEAIPFTLQRVEQIAKPVMDTARVSVRTPQWNFTARASIWSSPLLIDDQLYFGSDDSCFYALNSANGTLVYKFTTRGKVRGNPSVFASNIVFSSDDGWVYCLKRRSGELLWKTRINNGKFVRIDPSLTQSDFDYALSSPVYEENSIFIGSTDSCLYALNAVSGKVNWKFKTDHIIRATPQVYEKLVYCATWSGRCYAIDRQTGTQVWMVDLHQPVLSQPAVKDGKLVIGSRHAWLWCLDTQTGHEIWKYNYWWSWVESSPVIEDEIIYIGSSDLRRILAINLDSGKTLWSFHTAGYPWATASIDHSLLYIGSVGHQEGDDKGCVYVLNKKNGMLKEKLNVDGTPSSYLTGIYGKIAIGKTMFYATTLGGKIIAYKK